MITKKHIIVLVIFVTSLQFGQAQSNVYHLFPNSNALWSQRLYYNYLTCPFTANCGSNDNYAIQGDTIKGIHTYHKIYKSSQYFPGFTTSFTSPVTKTFFGGIRQDSIAKKIYGFISTGYGNGGDTLLYNFNLNLNDTLVASYCNNTSYKNYVSSIDTVLVGTTYRKRFNLSTMTGTLVSNINYVSLIEGIGGTFGLFGKLVPPFEGGTVLNCFSQNTVTQYINPLGTLQCNLVLSIKDQSTNNALSLSLYPNPFNASATLVADKFFNNATLSFYNSLGQLVKQIKNITGQQVIIPRGDLLKGLYFIYLTEENKTLATIKFVISGD